MRAREWEERWRERERDRDRDREMCAQLHLWIAAMYFVLITVLSKHSRPQDGARRTPEHFHPCPALFVDYHVPTCLQGAAAIVIKLLNLVVMIL